MEIESIYSSIFKDHLQVFYWKCNRSPNGKKPLRLVAIHELIDFVTQLVTLIGFNYTRFYAFQSDKFVLK